jgi:predicted O-methyltransferase YrrM
MIREVISEYGREIENLWDKLPGGMFDPLDSLALYSTVRYIKPKVIVEIGSLIGKSTCLIAKAMENNECGKLYSFDLEDKSKLAKRNVSELFPEANIEFIPGTVQSNLDKMPNDIGLLFIDGPHDKEFMKWCLDNLMDKTVGLILIHDINLSYDWNYRRTPDSEADCLIELMVKDELPITKIEWMEDWCLNHNYKEARNVLCNDFPIIGEWGVLNRPNMAVLSIWKKK